MVLPATKKRTRAQTELRVHKPLEGKACLPLSAFSKVLTSAHQMGKRSVHSGLGAWPPPATPPVSTARPAQLPRQASGHGSCGHCPQGSTVRGRLSCSPSLTGPATCALGGDVCGPFPGDPQGEMTGDRCFTLSWVPLGFHSRGHTGSASSLLI